MRTVPPGSRNRQAWGHALSDSAACRESCMQGVRIEHEGPDDTGPQLGQDQLPAHSGTAAAVSAPWWQSHRAPNDWQTDGDVFNADFLPSECGTREAVLGARCGQNRRQVPREHSALHQIGSNGDDQIGCHTVRQLLQPIELRICVR